MSQPAKWTACGRHLAIGALFVSLALTCQAGGVAYPMTTGILVGKGPAPGIHAITQGRQGTVVGSLIRYRNQTAQESLFQLGSNNVLNTLFQFDPLVTRRGSGKGTNTDGASVDGLVLGADGALYGSARAGGTAGVGTLFKLAPDGQFSVLHTFTRADDGANPTCLIAGADGNFYGTTASGGAGASGTVFQLTPAGTLTTLYAFPTGSNNSPDPTIVPTCPTLGADGNLYGVKYLPGRLTTQPDTELDVSLLYRVTPSGTYSEVGRFKLYISFGKGVGFSGEQPGDRLTVGRDGLLYGVLMADGGASDSLFRVNADGSITRNLAALPKGLEEPMPLPLVDDANGNLIGAAPYTNGSTSSILYSASADGASDTALYTFNDSLWTDTRDRSLYFDGYTPTTWIPDGSGNLIVASLGFNGTASIFRLEPDGGMTVSLSDGGYNTVTYGQDLNLEWSATGASQCSFAGTLPNPSLAGNQPLSAQITVPLTYVSYVSPALDFALQCSNGQGGISRSMLFLYENH